MTQEIEPRIVLLADYDRTFGFIEDAFADITPQRKTLMARPSIQFYKDMGLDAAMSGFLTPSTVRLLAFGVYQLQFPSTGVYAGQAVTYALLVYKAAVTATPTIYENRLVLYDITHNTQVAAVAFGATDSAATYGKIASMVGTFLTVKQIINVAAGGAGYAVNDTIVLAGGTFYKQAVLKVTTETAGAVTAVSVVDPGIYTVMPANPVAQDTTSGGGAGATFTLLGNHQTAGWLVQPEAGPNSSTNDLYAIFVDLFDGAEYTLLVSSLSSYGVSGFLQSSITSLSGFDFMLAGTSIVNSVPGDDLNWNALSFTQAFASASTKPVGLATHQGYLVAFGDSEVRLFYVTGATPGSAVAPVLNTSYGIGAHSQATIAESNECLAFVGATDGTGKPVYVFAPNSQVPERVSYPYLEGVLESETITTARFVTFRGHIGFCVNTAAGRSYIFDLHSKLWFKWNPFATLGEYALTTAAINANKSYTAGFDLSSTHFYLMTLLAAGSDVLYGGGLSGYTPMAVTPPQDFSTLDWKAYSSVAVVGDQTVAALTLSISYTDDNGQTYSTPRVMLLNQERPKEQNFGMARRRRFKATFSADWEVRIDGLELGVRKGCG